MAGFFGVKTVFSFHNLSPQYDEDPRHELAFFDLIRIFVMSRASIGQSDAFEEKKLLKNKVAFHQAKLQLAERKNQDLGAENARMAVFLIRSFCLA